MAEFHSLYESDDNQDVNEDVQHDEASAPVVQLVQPSASNTSAAPADLVAALVASIQDNLLTSDNSSVVRKAIAVTATDRKKVRRRNVDTDVSNSDLVVEAVRLLVLNGDTVTAASARAAKSRTERLTISAPAWWWTVATLAAEAVGATVADVVAAGISKRLP